MSYQVIARKWRPQTFEEVTGQEPITRTLRNAIEHERLHHAYLFSGARGVGKTTTARLFAKALNCHKSKSPTPTPCAIEDPTACPSCREIAEARSIDVLEIDAASHTQVANVRDTIIESINFAPARDRYKVFIIDEVHMLSASSFNALLKTLEEPPARVVFIMATTERHKVPDTILSRCQQFEFRTIATSRIAERLQQIAIAEKVNISEEALREIARAGEGSMRDAQSAFDQVISFSGPEISAEDVEAALGLASAGMLARVTAAIAEQKSAEVLAVVEDLVMRGHDLRNFCRDFLSHLRDLLVSRISGDTTLLDTAATDSQELMRQAQSFSESDLVRFFRSLSETEVGLREAAHPRYQLEVGLVKLIEMRRMVPISDLLERLAALEEAVQSGADTVLMKTPSPVANRRGQSGPTDRSNAASSGATARPGARKTQDTEVAGYNQRADPPLGGTTQASAPQSPVLTLVQAPGLQTGGGYAAAATQPAWEEEPEPTDPALQTDPSSNSERESTIERIKAALEKRKRMILVIALDGASKALLEDDELCIEFAPESKHLRENLAKPESVKLLREVCREVTGRDTGIRISVKERGVNLGEPLSRHEAERAEKQRLLEIAEQHPLVQQALRTLRGEIVDVRKIEGQ